MDRRSFLKALPVLVGAAPAIAEGLARPVPILTTAEILQYALDSMAQALAKQFVDNTLVIVDRNNTPW